MCFNLSIKSQFPVIYYNVFFFFFYTVFFINGEHIRTRTPGPRFFDSFFFFISIFNVPFTPPRHAFGMNTYAITFFPHYDCYAIDETSNREIRIRKHIWKKNRNQKTYNPQLVRVSGGDSLFLSEKSLLSVFEWICIKMKKKNYIYYVSGIIQVDTRRANISYETHGNVCMYPQQGSCAEAQHVRLLR